MKQESKSKSFLYILIGVSLIGFIDALYLFYSELSGNFYCLIEKGIFECETVNTSVYAKFLGVHVSLWGIIYYIIIILLVFLFIYQQNIYWLSFFLPAVSLFGLAFSVYLTVIEIVIIQALCEFCLLSAICSVLIFIFVLIAKHRNFSSIFFKLDFWNFFSKEENS